MERNGIEFEKELARAMRYVAAPEGFADRIMERAAKGDSARAVHAPVRSPERGTPKVVMMMPKRQWMGWASGAIAAMLVAGVFVGQHVRVEHEQRAVAEKQFETATRITDQALEHAREQLAAQGIKLNGE